jgi:hypothetical protein
MMLPQEPTLCFHPMCNDALVDWISSLGVTGRVAGCSASAGAERPWLPATLLALKDHLGSELDLPGWSGGGV